MTQSEEIAKQVALKAAIELTKDKFNIETENVDNEIATIAGPQLVVPVDNARYALNAANARWGSLYDALYGTDVISGDKGKDFNEKRAQTVIAYVRKFLDEYIPVNGTSWKNISNLIVNKGNLIIYKDENKFKLKHKYPLDVWGLIDEDPDKIPISRSIAKKLILLQ